MKVKLSARVYDFGIALRRCGLQQSSKDLNGLDIWRGSKTTTTKRESPDIPMCRLFEFVTERLCCERTQARGLLAAFMHVGTTIADF